MDKIEIETMSANDTENSVFHTTNQFYDLPLEVISHIFSFLPVSDLQEARCVCSNWYLASLAPALLEQEKAVSKYQTLDPQLLLKSNREFLNLSLWGYCDIDWFSEEFWKPFGSNLRSLSFSYCNVKEDQLLRILSNCPRLKSLEISECEYLFSSDQQGANTNKNETIVLKLLHLESLKIANIVDPRYKLFDTLVNSAPNLKSLSLDDCLSATPTLVDGSQALTFKHVVTYLREKPHRIDSLHLTCSEEEDDEAFVEAATLPNLRLTRLQTDYSKAAALLSCQTWLQEIELTCDADDLLLKTICTFVPTLKRLSLFYCSQVTSGVKLLHLLPNLTSLSLLQCCQISGDTILESLCNKVNRTLRKLALTELSLVSHLPIAALAKSHPALTHLDLSYCVGVTDWSIQAIFRYLKSLQSLTLIQCRNVTDAGLAGAKIYCHSDFTQRSSLIGKHFRNLDMINSDGYCNPTGCGISALKNLQKLDLNSCNVTGVSFKIGLKLPSIRHLILDNNTISKEAFRALFENNPTIEDLELSTCYGFQDDLVPVIIENLRRLRSIDIEDCCGVNEESINSLKKHCRRVKY